MGLRDAHRRLRGFGGLLLAGGRRDRRAQLLGAVLLVAASLFANRPLSSVPESAPLLLQRAAMVLRAIEPGAFRSLLVWMFASSFPRLLLTGAWGRVGAAGMVASALLGVLLFAASIGPLILQPSSAGIESLLAVQSPDGVWRLNTIFTLSGLVLIVVNMRAAGGTVRRRAELFVWALVLGTGPILAQAVAESAIASYGTLMSQPLPRMWSGLISIPSCGPASARRRMRSMPGRCSRYACLVRGAIRYALARATILTLVAVPFTVLFWFLYDQRGQPLAEILSGRRQLVPSSWWQPA